MQYPFLTGHQQLVGTHASADAPMRLILSKQQRACLSTMLTTLGMECFVETLTKSGQWAHL